MANKDTAPLSWQHYRARIASLTRDRADDDPELVEARRLYRVRKLSDYIQDQLPELTAADRRYLAGLFR